MEAVEQVCLNVFVLETEPNKPLLSKCVYSRMLGCEPCFETVSAAVCLQLQIYLKFAVAFVSLGFDRKLADLLFSFPGPFSQLSVKPVCHVKMLLCPPPSVV